MKKILVLLAVSAGAAPAAHGQYVVSGKVLDKQTHQPVPYASVVVAGSHAGTTSNAEGEFTLAMPHLPVKVLAFSLGYGRDSTTVAVAGPLPALVLAPAPVVLPAVEPGSYAAELLANAYRYLQRTNSHKEYGQAFYRQVTRLDNDPTEVQEMVWNVRTSNAGMEGSTYAQGRYAAKKALLHFKNFPTHTQAFSIFSASGDSSASHAVVSLQAARDYSLRLKGVVQNGSQQIAEIAFVNKPETNPRPRQGSVFIDVATYQVVHFQSTMPVSSSSNNPLFKFKNPTLTFDFDLRAQAAGPTPTYLKASYLTQITRPFKADIKVQVESFTFFYNSQSTSTGLPYSAAKDAANDLAASKQRPYDAAFWRSNPVVKRTPLENEVVKSFEQKGAFGTLLTK